MNEYIKSDLFRYYGNCKTKTFVTAFLKNRAFRHMVGVRMSNNSKSRSKIRNIPYYLLRDRNIQICPGTKIGYGLYIGHNGPVIVNENAVIGNNVNLSQFVTIGSNGDDAAIIGNNTYIGPNVCLVDSVVIGDNVTIGAGSVVTKNIPEDATAAGNYAKVLNYNNPGRYIGNRWTFNI